MSECGLRWYLFGAQAAIIWGSPRLSADADITAKLEPAAVDPFIETMRRHGFDPVPRDPNVDVNGTSIPVISPEDLIITKVLAGRPKDIEDIRGVIHEKKTSLDVHRIRTILDLLEQALSQSDLLPVFEKAWGEESQ